VVVDKRTQHSTRVAIAYRELEPVQVKGKSEPIAIWLAVEAKSRFGVAFGAEQTSIFIGREHEMGLLTEAFRRATSLSSPQLVTIIGEPGVGKSRLVHELYRWIDDQPDLIWWRQGRCLSYGDGVSFWALGEIVKSHAGILESEPPDQASIKLEAAVAALIEDEADARWVLSRLQPLAGIGKAEAERSELFTAWLRFLEAIAARGPLVMVVEDLHWADEAMLEFLEHLLDGARDAPILLVGTARPELYGVRPNWGGGRPDAATIGLKPLSPTETAHLVAALSKRPLMAAPAQQALLERSGGNPLYLTEYVRLAAERGLLDRLGETAELPLPETVQAIIAARLDLLSPEDKALLQAASVVGKVFWSGALAVITGTPMDAVESTLRRLTRRDLVRPVRRSSMFGQDEHAFAHVLTGDVAYGQLPRRRRAHMHEAMGRWLEATSGKRVEEVSELLAHHYSTALELEPTTDSGRLERVYQMLMLAGERVKGLDATRAGTYFERAGRIAQTDQQRGRALLQRARHSDTAGTEEVFGDALVSFRAAGDVLGELEVLVEQGGLHQFQGEASLADGKAAEALALVERLPPGEEVATALAFCANMRYLRGNEKEGIELAERAIEIARSVGASTAYARALMVKSSALIELGDLAAEQGLEEALGILVDRGETQKAMGAYANRATLLGEAGRVAEARSVIDEAIEYGRSRGQPAADVDWSLMTKCEALFPMGDWDELLDVTDRLIEADARRGGTQVGSWAKGWQAAVLHYRGLNTEAIPRWQDYMAASRDARDPQGLFPALRIGIVLNSAAGLDQDVTRLIDEVALLGPEHPYFLTDLLPWVGGVFVKRGRTALLESLMVAARVGAVPFRVAQIDRLRGLLKENIGEPAEALDLFRPVWEVGEQLGHVFWPTMARIDAGRCALAAGQPEVAAEHLAEARTGAESMRAELLLSEIRLLEGDGNRVMVRGSPG
jgi:tetratricopeptide (TPR) repeat protein